MRSLEADDEDSYKRQFGKYIKLGVNADSVRIFFFIIYVQTNYWSWLNTRSVSKLD